MTKPIKDIILSTAVSENKATTNGYKVTELYTLQDLLYTMNRQAVTSGLFSNGHRGGNHLRAMGNIYFIDIDAAPSGDEKPYYQIIEEKLRQRNISFISVPSKSADQYPYKRHIAILLDSRLTTGKKAFKKVSHHILDAVGIDLCKIDNRVAFNNVSFLAPACINKNFAKYDELSSFYDGEALTIPDDLKACNDEVTISSDITTNQMIHFSDGSTVTVHEAKKLIATGEKKSCYCPSHDDKNPSATFYHNNNGRVEIFCGACGTIKINTNFIPTIPSIPHSDYGYSIILNNVSQSKISTLVSEIGNYSYKIDRSVVWAYSVTHIGDIYQLLLAKVYLVEKGFDVSPIPTEQKHHNLLNTVTLKPITKNVTLPTIYTPQGIPRSEYFYQHKQIATYAFKHYLFVESAIHATYQNIIAPSRPFNDTCNTGLAYFDYVLEVMKKEKGLNQSNKTYPMKLQGKDKKKITQQRIKNMAQGKKVKMTARQKKVMKLVNDEKHLKFNCEPNITEISKKLGINRKTLYRDIEAVNAKKKAQ